LRLGDGANDAGSLSLANFSSPIRTALAGKIGG
jgi:hypothetical protein